MGGFFGVASSNDCIQDVFSEPIITRIWEQDAVV